MMNNGNNNIRARGQVYTVYAEWPDGRQQTLGLVQAHSAAQALRRWAGPAPDGGKLVARLVLSGDPDRAAIAKAESH